MTSLLKKAFLKLIAVDPRLDRLVRYRNPRSYWQKRGGDRYFEEQEAVYDRTLRSRFMGQEINRLDYHSLLEIGCGYGKQLKNFLPKGVFLVGCDYSRPQLLKSRDYLKNIPLNLIEADAADLPFQDGTFEAVLSSAVILHNEYDKARRILAEMIRVGRKYLIHNEDTDITFSRYGYDLKRTYETMNFKIVESKEIPVAADPSITQFTIVELPPEHQRIRAADIPLAYHLEP